METTIGKKFFQRDTGSGVAVLDTIVVREPFPGWNNIGGEGKKRNTNVFVFPVETNNQQPSRQVGSRLARFGGNGRPYTRTPLTVSPLSSNSLSSPTGTITLRLLLLPPFFLPPFQIETHFLNPQIFLTKLDEK